MRVHVSIHDVSPVHVHAFEAALGLCLAHGAKPALLVVPDYHGRAPLRRDPAFCERLRALQQRGHEIYLHGFFHRAQGAVAVVPGPLARLRRRWFQSVVSGGEAELEDVSEAEGLRRLDRGEEELRLAGLRIDGFVAPAWSMPRWRLPALAARGYRFTEDHLRVYDPRRGSSRPSVVLNYASRTPARVLSTVAYCRLARPFGALWPARIAIHPWDMHLPLLRHEIDSLLAWGASHRWAGRGVELLAASA